MKLLTMSCYSDLVRIKSKDLRIKRIQLMSTDTGYHSHSGVQDPKAPQVAPLYPQKPSPSKNKPEPSSISLQASCHVHSNFEAISHQMLPLWLSWSRICLQCGRPGFNPWVGRSPGEGKGYPLQYSGLANCMDCNSPGSSVPGDSQGKNTGVSCHALSQQIFQPRD